MTQTIRIFISSPGDVSEEREKARRVIESLERHYDGLTLQPVLWEDLALPATTSFQVHRLYPRTSADRRRDQ